MSEAFGKLLKQDGAGLKGEAASVIRRTRIDARTAGYPVPGNPHRVVWLGMSPAGESGDLWRVVQVEEESNDRLTHVREGERLVDIDRGNEKDPPLSFEKALERLAVWEFSNMQSGMTAATGQTIADLGHIYFKDIAMRRGLVISTVGEVAEVPGGMIPEQGRRFLKSDLERMREYREGLRKSDDPLSVLLQAQEPLHVNDSTIEEDIVSFGEINLVDKMRFFARALVEFSKIQLKFIEEFYGMPSAPNREGLYDRLNANSFFSEALIARYNTLRTEFAMSIFRHATVNEADWGDEIDFNDRRIQVELAKRPAMKAVYDYLARDVKLPLDAAEVESLTIVSARALLYFREMLKDSGQKDALERAGIYKQTDVEDLLNFLDLLDVKYQYMELARTATTLRGTKEKKELDLRLAEFQKTVKGLKENLSAAGNFSAAQEAQIDTFIKASAPVYLLDRIASFPDRLQQAYDFISSRILPRPHQLSLALDFSQCARRPVAAPTMKTRDSMAAALSGVRPPIPN